MPEQLPKTIPEYNELTVSHGWKSLVTLLISFLTCTILFLGSIYAYFAIILGSESFHSLSFLTLLDSPSTIAFQLLLMNLSLLAAPLIVLISNHVNLKNAFSFQKAPVFSFFISLVLILAASVLIDQLLYWVLDVLLRGRFTSDSSSSLNISSLIGNFNQINFVSLNILVFIAVLVGPVIEELFFRGALWNSFRSKYNFWQSAVLVSFFFALIHFDFTQGISSFLLSLILCLIVERTKSVWPCIVAHIGSSYMTFVFSQKGLTYGVGGSSYPIEILLTAILATSGSLLYLFLLCQKNKAKEICH
jgi:membrane protease YdiL (CAAX protease family)